jgi:hypothetical protein
MYPEGEPIVQKGGGFNFGGNSNVSQICNNWTELLFINRDLPATHEWSLVAGTLAFAFPLVIEGQVSARYHLC